MKIFRFPIILLALVVATPAFAARCGGDFDTFLADMSADAQAAGISQAVIGQAFAGVTEDGAVLNFDRRQRYTFNKTFEQYVSTRVGSGRINGGRAMLAAPRRAVVADRGDVLACRGRFWSRSGDWRPISARATWASCR